MSFKEFVASHTGRQFFDSFREFVATFKVYVQHLAAQNSTVADKQCCLCFGDTSITDDVFLRWQGHTSLMCTACAKKKGLIL